MSTRRRATKNGPSSVQSFIRQIAAMFLITFTEDHFQNHCFVLHKKLKARC